MEDIKQFKDVFLKEANEHVANMNSYLLKLEKKPQDSRLLKEIFRAAHTLKSMSATMDYDKTAGLCHAIEDILDLIKKKKIKLSRCVDILFECFDVLDVTLKNISDNKEEQNTDLLVKKLETLKRRDYCSPTRPLADTPAHFEAEDEPPEMRIEKIKNIEVKVEKLDLLMNLAEELLINKMRLDGIKDRFDDPELTAFADTMGRLITDLQYNVMQVRMVPIGFIFNRFPRMIRDLAKQEKKEVNLIMEGNDIELDRTVIDQIGEALVHLLRNAVDHGIETSEERKKAGKPPQGAVTLAARRDRGFVVIEVEDDGYGINWKDIKNTAIKQGMLTDEATIEELTDLIFSGLSTSKSVTAVSGRGLGLGIIKSKVESLGGTIKVESKQDVGTKFRIEFPLTLAVINTLFVNVGGETFAIPLVNIEKLVDIKEKNIKGMLNYEAIVLQEEDIPLIRLSVLFDMPSADFKNTLEACPVVVVRKGADKIGVIVDSLMNTQEIVIKPSNKLLKENKYFAGSTIIGSGKVVLILDVANLVLIKKHVRSGMVAAGL